VFLVLRRIVTRHDWRLLFWLVIPFATVQIPSVLDMDPLNVPAMGRMVGVTPFVMSAIAFAIYASAVRLQEALRPRTPRADFLVAGAVSLVLAAILAVNMYNYFVVYPRTLPDGNTPFDLAIAQNVDRTGAAADSIVVGCCWGEWGQPEPDAVLYRVHSADHLQLATNLQDALTKLSTQVPRGTEVVLYLDPSLQKGGRLLASQVIVTRQSMLSWNGWDVARVVVGRKR
jgi:hypothetical protein